MSITNSPLEITRGDSKTYTLLFRDENDACVNITGWTIFFTVKQNAGQSDDDAKIKKDITIHTDPLNGQSAIELTSSDTASLQGGYLYDIQYKDASGKIHTIVEGIFSVAKDITRRTS